MKLRDEIENFSYICRKQNPYKQKPNSVCP